jgi:putative protease
MTVVEQRKAAGEQAYKPELIISAGSMEEVRRYLAAGADAVTVGNLTYAECPAGSMNSDEIAQAVRLAHEDGKRVYVTVSKIIDNRLLDGLPDYLRSLEQAGVDAVIFGDPAVLMCVKDHRLQLKLHWSAEMTTTNYMTANYWAAKGAKRTILARELNMEEIKAFKQHADHEVQVQVHGLTNIYHSKRKLVRHYLNYQGRELEPVHQENGKVLFLIEKERPDQRYPIIENENGTHIMSAEDYCYLECLDELMELKIDAFYIEGLLKPVEYNETVIRSYRQAIDAYTRDPGQYEFREEWIDAIHELQDPGRELTFGFLFKEQVY